MDYRELRDKLNKLRPDQLDMSVTIWLVVSDELAPLSDFTAVQNTDEQPLLEIDY